MVKETDVMISVASMINFIKSQIPKDLMEAKNKNIIDVDMEQLQKLTSIVETSIQNNFVKASTEITSLFKNS